MPRGWWWGKIETGILEECSIAGIALKWVKNSCIVVAWVFGIKPRFFNTVFLFVRYVLLVVAQRPVGSWSSTYEGTKLKTWGYPQDRGQKKELFHLIRSLMVYV